MKQIGSAVFTASLAPEMCNVPIGMGPKEDNSKSKIITKMVMNLVLKNKHSFYHIQINDITKYL